jgi:hypothetical protein
MELVAFSGYARSGKDTAADALLPLGFQRVAFADKLRECLYALNPTVKGLLDNHGNPIFIINTIKELIDSRGWDGYKESPWGPETRELLQRLGTEVGRNILGENIWVDATLNNLDPNGKYVVTDCRFVNEADAVRNRGGKIYRICRQGIGPANSHPSETSLDDYDFDGVIANTDIEYFRATVRGLVCA